METQRARLARSLDLPVDQCRREEDLLEHPPPPPSVRHMQASHQRQLLLQLQEPLVQVLLEKEEVQVRLEPEEVLVQVLLAQEEVQVRLEPEEVLVQVLLAQEEVQVRLEQLVVQVLLEQDEVQLRLELEGLLVLELQVLLLLLWQQAFSKEGLLWQEQLWEQLPTWPLLHPAPSQRFCNHHSSMAAGACCSPCGQHRGSAKHSCTSLHLPFLSGSAPKWGKPHASHTSRAEHLQSRTMAVPQPRDQPWL